MILAIFDLQVTLMLPTKIKVDGPFGSEELKNIFFKMAAILDFRSERFYLFLIYKSPRCFLPGKKSNGLSLLEKKRNIDFQDGGKGGHLGFHIGTVQLFLIYKSPRCALQSFK